MRCISIIARLVALWVSTSVGPVSAAPISVGLGQQTADAAGTPLLIYTYRPKCAEPSILFVFHGLNRNADTYREYARVLGDRLCVLVVAPKFDVERFPTWKYQRGGIVDTRGNIQPQNQWTGRLVVALAEWVRKQEGKALPYSLIGHSAGGQFLSRVAAFTPNEARRMVVANPSTWVFPTLDTDAPYGLRRVYPESEAPRQLSRYLAAPVTVFLGREDLGDEGRNDGPEALAQGATRYDRGLNAFEAARKAAQTNGAAFNWRLAELPGVGHSAEKMFASQQALEALAP